MRAPNVGEREGDQSGSMRRKRWTPRLRKEDFKEERKGTQEKLS